MSQEKLTLSQRYDLAQNELQQLGNIIARVEERVDIFTKNNNSSSASHSTTIYKVVIVGPRKVTEKAWVANAYTMHWIIEIECL